MIITENLTLELLAGARIPQVISGFEFDNASQITILLYKANESGYAKAWTKSATDKYPNAGVIEKRESDSILFISTMQVFSTLKASAKAVQATKPMPKRYSLPTTK